MRRKEKEEREVREKYLMEGEADGERNERNVTTMTVTFYDPRERGREKESEKKRKREE